MIMLIVNWEEEPLLKLFLQRPDRSDGLRCSNGDAAH